MQMSWRKCVTIQFENPGSRCLLQGLAPVRHLADGGMSFLMSAGGDHLGCVCSLHSGSPALTCWRPLWNTGRASRTTTLKAQVRPGLLLRRDPWREQGGRCGWSHPAAQRCRCPEEGDIRCSRVQSGGCPTLTFWEGTCVR